MLVVVCEKCGRRAGRKGLRSDLKTGFKESSGQRRVKVLESGCLGSFPKRGIALATPDALARGRLFVLGEDAPVQDAIDALIADQNSESCAPGFAGGRNRSVRSSRRASLNPIRRDAASKRRPIIQA